MELQRWEDLEEHLRVTGRFPARFVDESGAGVRFQQHVRGVAVPVAVRPVMSGPAGKAWIALTVPLCAIAELRMRGALLANTLLPVGALAAWKEQVVVRQLLPLAGLRVSALEHALRALTGAAVALRSPSGPYGYVLR